MARPCYVMFWADGPVSRWGLMLDILVAIFEFEFWPILPSLVPLLLLVTGEPLAMCPCIFVSLPNFRLWGYTTFTWGVLILQAIRLIQYTFLNLPARSYAQAWKRTHTVELQRGSSCCCLARATKICIKFNTLYKKSQAMWRKVCEDCRVRLCVIQ